jgi:hypothetical protein
MWFPFKDWTILSDGETPDARALLHLQDTIQKALRHDLHKIIMKACKGDTLEAFESVGIKTGG